MTACERDIYRVVVYFSFFSYPVTAFEIWKWQLRPSSAHSLERIFEVLEGSMWLKKHVQQKDGFYGIGDIEHQVATRHDRYEESVKKYRKVRRILQYLSRIKTVEGIALCNSLAFHFGRKQSDIDLFVITKKGAVWSTRFLAVLPFLLLRERPGEGKRHPVDMSFFVSRNALSLASLRLKDGDPYFSYWMRSLVPLYERRPGVFEDLQDANSWAQEDLPMSSAVQPALLLGPRPFLSLPHLLPEAWAKWLSVKRFPPVIQDVMNVDTRVVVSDTILKFHTVDRREAIRDGLVEQMKLCEIES